MFPTLMNIGMMAVSALGIWKLGRIPVLQALLSCHDKFVDLPAKYQYLVSSYQGSMTKRTQSLKLS